MKRLLNVADKSSPGKGERADVKRPSDNLKPEGNFIAPDKSFPGVGDRADVKRPQDNLAQSGDFVGE